MENDNIQALTLAQEAANKMGQFLALYKRQIYGVIPKHMDPKRIGYLILNQVSKSPALAGCTPMSFINAILQASNLGLEICANSAYLVPFGTECQLLIDYRGKLGIAARSGVTIDPPILVRDGDTFIYGYTSAGLRFEWQPSDFETDGREIVAGFAMAENSLGKKLVTVLSLSEIERTRRRSRNGRAEDFEHYKQQKKGLTLSDIRALEGKPVPRWYALPWVTDYDAMALKTIVHRAFNRVPSGGAMALSQEIDDAAEGVKPMPVAEQLAETVDQVDPAHDRPLIDGGGETKEDQVAARESVKQRKLKALAAVASKSQTLRDQMVAEFERVGREEFFKVLGVHGFSASNEVTEVAAADILKDLKELQTKEGEQ